MTQLSEIETAASSEAATTERRRPGRQENISPELIPILRGKEPEVEIEFEDVDQTAAIRGVFFGVLLSAPMWAAVAYLGSLLLSK